MNGLLMFISVLGGVSLFGLLGMVPGTLVSATVTGPFAATRRPEN